MQELRDGGEVPIGIRHMCMTEIGGELRQVVFDVIPVPVPLQEGLDGEAVTKVMNSRSAGILWSAQTNLLG